MDLQTKIERIKTEVKFLIEGVGTLEEKQAATAEIGGFAQAVFKAHAAKKPEQELQTISASDVGNVADVIGPNHSNNQE